MTGCPDENVLVGLADGALSEGERETVERHLDDCAPCTRLVRELAGLAVPARPVPERYRIVRQLGTGAMGVVWEAEDTMLGRRVALKFVSPEGSGDRERRERLIREARALAQLRHPNVIAVHDAGETGDEMFLALELVDGTDARSWRAATPRSREETLAVWLQAAAGLAAVHAAGLVHRDVKPDNVLVAADGRVLLGDFGLATGTPGVATTLTQTGAMIGTPLYMAPEQLDGAAATARSDQFALCAAIWEALAGARPFPGSTIGALAVAMTRPPVPPARDPLFAVLARGLAADPEERWPDVTALAAALASPPRSRRALLFAGAGVTVATALAATAIVARSGEEPRETEGRVTPSAPTSDSPVTGSDTAPTKDSTTPTGSATQTSADARTPDPPATQTGADPRSTTTQKTRTGAEPRTASGSEDARTGSSGARVATADPRSGSASSQSSGAGSQQVRISPPPIPVQPTPKVTPPKVSEWRRVLDAADDKIRVGDGAGCLALMATIPPVPAAMEDSAVSTLAICTMLAGDCPGGREIIIKWGTGRGWSRERAEGAADNLDLAHCAIEAAPSARAAVRAKARLVTAAAYKQSCKPIFAKIAARNLALPGAPQDLAMLEVQCHVIDGECAKAREKYATVVTIPSTLPADRIAELEANREKAFKNAFPRCSH